ncbi:MAG: hypothetical protein OEY59_02410 [Deltaproteobacteria bacterium]|nr:hypothetical protein [Deltaproteobacteria bacterium]
MKNSFKICTWVIILLIPFLMGCKKKSSVITNYAEGITIHEPDSNGLINTANSSSVQVPLSGQGSITHLSYSSAGGEFAYTHHVGDVPLDIYMIFTNKSGTSNNNSTQVSYKDSQSTSNFPDNTFSSRSNEVFSQDISGYAIENGIGLRGKPQATRFNASPLPFVENRNYQALNNQLVEPRKNIIGDVDSFIDVDGQGATVFIPSTLRQVITDGTITLNLWVENASWGSCSKAYCINQTIVDSVGSNFLKTGSNNDIYDWVSNIYGAPWGAQNYGNLLDPSAANQIDILFFDIENDNSTIGGILGFFWAKDNYKKTSYSISNERLMLYIDSVLVATPDQTWDITDYWPAEMVATMAHEFQHMIQFYQKSILRNLSGNEGEVWLNEMASMVTEDLVAEKLGNIGPRGVAATDGTAGAANNHEGRLPLFNLYLNKGVTQWSLTSSPLPNYSVSYAFGAYLVRNFGGPVLFRKIVQSGRTNYLAVEEAVQALGYDETFESLLKKWAVASLISDSTTAPSSYRYNIGGFFNYALDGVNYNLGSINLYNYTDGSIIGPQFYLPGDLINLTSSDGYSNTFVEVINQKTGTFTSNIMMGNTVKLTVVTKAP